MKFICMSCDKDIKVNVDVDKFKEWMSKPRRECPLVQDEFPELTPEEREVMLSGFCQKCWNAVAKEEE